MIVRPKPDALVLLSALRGSVLPQIAWRLVGVTVLSVGVILASEKGWLPLPQLSITPFTLMGLTLSIFLSFRNNACYDRWWEGRKQWGALIVEIRSLAREVTTLLPGEAHAATRARILKAVIGFAHALAARLRGEDQTRAADPWLEEGAGSLRGRRNPPDAVLTLIGEEITAQMRSGHLSDRLYQVLEGRLCNMSGIQAACERILTTPLPFAYTLLLHRTAYLFCLLLPFGLAGSLGWWTPLIAAVVAYTFFGLDALGDELEEPFGLAQNDLPLNALVRVIEIDLLDVLGEPVPQPLAPKGFLLQ